MISSTYAQERLKHHCGVQQRHCRAQSPLPPLFTPGSVAHSRAYAVFAVDDSSMLDTTGSVTLNYPGAVALPCSDRVRYRRQSTKTASAPHHV